jgi:hypothetical protein
VMLKLWPEKDEFYSWHSEDIRLDTLASQYRYLVATTWILITNLLYHVIFKSESFGFSI